MPTATTMQPDLSFDAKLGSAAEPVNYLRRAMVLEMAVRLSLLVQGNIIEFGVADGSSTRVIRRTLRRYRRRFVPWPNKKIFALDSFEGLTQRFESAEIGTFAGQVPKIRGIEFIKGYFEKTCTSELAHRVGRVALAHLDADLYDSTLTALRWLTPLLQPGSLLLFDEFSGQNRSEQRAFDSWRYETETRLARIAEFDRDPSGFGNVPDRRLLFQVLGAEPLAQRDERGSFPWLIDYYLGRLGLKELQSRFRERF
jgi:hypothetical protein